MASTLLRVSWTAAIGALLFAGEASAGWGDENWGAMSWELSAPIPILGPLGFAALAIGLAVAAARKLHRDWARVALPLVVIAIPLGVLASSLSMPNTFANGTVADAVEVNQNFSAVAAAVNDNDARIAALEGLQCFNVESGSFARTMRAQCPAGTLLTGGGCSAQNTDMWIATSVPIDASNEWLCTVGGGSGNVNAIARCCEY
jgi:hypothetical protein